MEPWSLNLDSNKAPRLHLSDSEISLERNRLTSSIDVATVIDAYYQRLRQSDTFQKLGSDELDVQPPPGRDRNVGNYYSLQHQFPANYGIGAMGLPESATPQRQAQAKQLKAYLMFFDQLLANYFTQLASRWFRNLLRRRKSTCVPAISVVACGFSVISCSLF